MNEVMGLKLEAEKLENNFIDQCKAHGFYDKWDAYRNEVLWTEVLEQAHKDWITKLHEFYGKRDGPNGFLGGKGL